MRHRSIGMLLILLLAVLSGLGSLFYTRYLVNILENEEREKAELWAEATRLIAVADSSQNIELLLSVIENNNTIPVILTDTSDAVISAANFDPGKTGDPDYIRRKLEKIRKQNEPIKIDLGAGYYNNIYYRDSIILTQLHYYPFIQSGIILLLILVAYFAFSSSRKAESNRVWVAMSKETAHQLGTPTSSLAGWVEVLQHKYPDVAVADEIAVDVARLEKITERFSRIGSNPPLSGENIIQIINETIEYLKKRTSSKVVFNTETSGITSVVIPVNRALFEWVIENVSRNAIDAMDGSGEITYRFYNSDRSLFIDITDTGKGIPKRAFKKIFNPGYTTKQRGWGLGLSLARRIIEEFHGGRIYVRYSEPGKGSCIRIILNK